MIFSFTLTEVVSVHLLFCATAVPSGAHTQILSLISKYFEATENLQCKWLVEEALFFRKKHRSLVP